MNTRKTSTLLKILHDHLFLMNGNLRIVPQGLCGIMIHLREKNIISIGERDILHAHIYDKATKKPFHRYSYIWERGNIDRRMYWLKSQIKIETIKEMIDFANSNSFTIDEENIPIYKEKVKYNDIPLVMPDNSNPHNPIFKEQIIFDEENNIPLHRNPPPPPPPIKLKTIKQGEIIERPKSQIINWSRGSEKLTLLDKILKFLKLKP